MLLEYGIHFVVMLVSNCFGNINKRKRKGAGKMGINETENSSSHNHKLAWK